MSESIISKAFNRFSFIMNYLLLIRRNAGFYASVYFADLKFPKTTDFAASIFLLSIQASTMSRLTPRYSHISFIEYQRSMLESIRLSSLSCRYNYTILVQRILDLKSRIIADIQECIAIAFSCVYNCIKYLYQHLPSGRCYFLRIVFMNSIRILKFNLPLQNFYVLGLNFRLSRSK